MRESHVLVIKTSMSKAWAKIIYLFFCMLVVLGLWWLIVSHSTSSTAYGPLLFFLFAAGIAPFGLLADYFEIKRGPTIRYILTPHGLIYPEMTQKLIPWTRIQNTSLRTIVVGQVFPYPIIITLDVDQKLIDSLEMSLSDEFARKFLYLFGVRRIWLSASGLEVSPNKLLEIIDAYRLRWGASAPPENHATNWTELVKAAALQN